MKAEIIMNNKDRSFHTIVIIFLLCLSLISLTNCKNKKETPPPTPTPTNTPVPSMEKIVYTYNGNLYWINTDGSGKELLFQDNNSKWFPSVSPSGWYITYWVQRNEYYNLWLADLHNNKSIQLTFDEDKIEGDIQNFKINNTPAWSYDESYIIYSRNKNIWRITKDGFNQESLTFSNNCISPSLSKDNKIVYVKIESMDAYNLYIKDINMANEEKLTNYKDKKVISPDFSNDGKKIAFALNYGENIDILIMNLDSKKIDQITFDGKSFSPKFSHSNDKIVYTNFVLDKYQPEIWIMNADGSGKNKITSDGGYSPSWLYRILAEPQITPIILNKEVKTEKIEEPLIFETQEITEEIQEPVISTIPSRYDVNELSVKLVKQGDNLLFYPVIHFDSGAASIKQEFYPILDEMLIILKKYESPIVIKGHTDNVPIHTIKYPSNYELSMDRANEVRKYLIKNGINEQRVSIEGYADKQPLMPNDTPENMYTNRRAEILIKIIKAEENKIINDLNTPETEAIDTPTPEPTPSPTPKPKNIFEKLIKKGPKKSKVTSW